jgi:hypothetical protein
MKLKVFDFICSNPNCNHVIKNLTVDEESGTTYLEGLDLLDLTCPVCGALVERSDLMAPVKHVSWSTWRNLDNK